MTISGNVKLVIENKLNVCPHETALGVSAQAQCVARKNAPTRPTRYGGVLWRGGGRYGEKKRGRSRGLWADRRAFVIVFA